MVDIAIQRTLVEIRRREADVLLVSNDGDFVDQVRDLLDGRRVGVVGFQEFRSNAFLALKELGLSTFDLEYEVQAFKEPLPRVRIIEIDDFDPVDFSSPAGEQWHGADDRAEHLGAFGHRSPAVSGRRVARVRP